MDESDLWGLILRLDSCRGQQLLQDVRAAASTNTLICESMLTAFVHQKHPCACSVTSAVICFNSLCQIDELRRRYRGHLSPRCAEDDVFRTDSYSRANEETIKRRGMVLEELLILCKSLGLQPHLWTCDSSVVCGQSEHKATSRQLTSVDEFRQLVKEVFSEIHQRLIVNFYQPALKTPFPFGHFSPVAAYHEADDRVLLLDVFSECVVGWVKVDDLFRAMDTVDSDSNLKRGCIVTQIL